MTQMETRKFSSRLSQNVISNGHCRDVHENKCATRVMDGTTQRQESKISTQLAPPPVTRASERGRQDRTARVQESLVHQKSEWKVATNTTTAKCHKSHIRGTTNHNESVCNRCWVHSNRDHSSRTKLPSSTTHPTEFQRLSRLSRIPAHDHSDWKVATERQHEQGTQGNTKNNNTQPETPEFDFYSALGPARILCTLRLLHGCCSAKRSTYGFGIFVVMLFRSDVEQTNQHRRCKSNSNHKHTQCVHRPVLPRCPTDDSPQAVAGHS